MEHGELPCPSRNTEQRGSPAETDTLPSMTGPKTPVLHVESEDDTTIITILAQTLGAQDNCFQCGEELDALPDSDGQIIIDCRQLHHIDSVAAATLVAFHKRMRQNGSAPLLCNIDPTVRSVLSVMRLDRVLTIKDTLGEARAWRPHSQSEKRSSGL